MRQIAPIIDFLSPSFTFQQLEQEKHRLRLQIEVMEDEYEQRIADLRSDLAAMKTREGAPAILTSCKNCKEITRKMNFHSMSSASKQISLSAFKPHVESAATTDSLAEAESRSREKDRERAHLVGQLGEQNQRLTGELEAAARREEELARQLEELRAQFQDKRETMRDHVMHLETLKDEVGR